jgi:methylaspartate ammonia-lyase
MSVIQDVLVLPGAGANYHEDLSKMQADAVAEGAQVVRELAEAVLVGLVLSDGRVAWGDCVGMVPRGKIKPWPAFRTAAGMRSILDTAKPFLVGRTLDFRDLSADIETLTEVVEEQRPVAPDQEGDGAKTEDDGVENAGRRALLTAAARLFTPYPISADEDEAGQNISEAVPMETVEVVRPLHPAVRYGVTQALLLAESMVRGVSMAEVIADEWGLPRPTEPVPIHAQCGAERHLSVDRMILRRVASLPGAFVDNIPEQMGTEGNKLPRYVRWIRQRIRELGDSDYKPFIHIDLNGALGDVFGDRRGPMLAQIYTTEFEARPYLVRLVDPIVKDSLEAQIEALQKLRRSVMFRGMSLKLVIGEWANSLDDIQAFIDAGVADAVHIKMPTLGAVSNSVEAVLKCRSQGVEAYLGGSPAEPDLAARVSAHVALATRPDYVLAKPGTGVDEAVSLTQNEMARTLAWIRARS